MKKLLSVSLAFFLILSFSLNGQAQGVSPENNINRNEISQEVWNKYMQLEEFQRHYKENPKDAKSMIERIIDHNMKILNEEDSIKPMSGNGTIALIYYPEFKQKNSYYCGPASALTAIYGMGKEGQVRGSTYTAKQDTLAANMGTINDGNGTYVYRTRNELNKYSTEVYDYFYEPSKSSMDNIIFGSLLSDNAPILHAQTEKIGYYNGQKQVII